MSYRFVRFTVAGKPFKLTREEVEGALAEIEPDRTWDLAVWINDKWFPPKQALVTPVGLTNRDINSRYAVTQLKKLGFEVHDTKSDGPLPDAPGADEPGTGAEVRAQSIQLAVQLLSGSGASASDAIAAAKEIEGWLAAR
jgi:hypothetical protein